MSMYKNFKKILQYILTYYISKGDKTIICNNISNEISNAGYSDVIKFLKWHNLLTLLPKDTIIKNDDAKRRTKKTNSELLILSQEISNNFKSHEITFCFLKGISLILSLYDDISLRSFNDIDIFVAKKDLSLCEQILIEMGFQQGDIIKGNIIPASKAKAKFQKVHTHELYQFIKKANEKFYQVDINHLFSWNGFDSINNNLPLDRITNEIELSSKFSLPILNSSFQFTHLCLHFYNEAIYFALENSYDGSDPFEIRLFRLFDICLLIHNEPINIKEILKISTGLKAKHKIEYVLSLIEYIFEDIIDLSNFKTVFDVKNIEKENYYYSKNGTRYDWPIKFSDRVFNPLIRCDMQIELF